MPLQEFWNDDPDLLWVYRNVYMEKEKQKLDLEKEEINFQAWLQGLYNFNAIAGALSKKPKYLDKPIELNPTNKTRIQENMEIAQKIKENIKRSKALLRQQRGEKKG